MNNIFYINLERRTDRKNNMENQFKKQNIQDYTRIQAVDYMDLNDLFNGFFEIDGKTFSYKNECDLIYRKRSPQTLGTIACVLSHLKTIYKAKHMNLDYAIIMEDDLSLDYLSEWELSFEKMFSLFPKDWCIIQLFTSNQYILRRIIPRTSLFTKKVLGDNNYCFLGTAFYVVSRKGIDMILGKYFNHLTNTFILKGKHPGADGLLYNINDSYIYNKPLVYSQDEIYESDLITIGSGGKKNRFGLIAAKITHNYYKKLKAKKR